MPERGGTGAWKELAILEPFHSSRWCVRITRMAASCQRIQTWVDWVLYREWHTWWHSRCLNRNQIQKQIDFELNHNKTIFLIKTLLEPHLLYLSKLIFLVYSVSGGRNVQCIQKQTLQFKEIKNTSIKIGGVAVQIHVHVHVMLKLLTYRTRQKR